MGIESVVIAMIVLVAMSVIFRSVGFMAYKGRSARRNAAGKKLALLADARAVEHRARTLLADCGEDLTIHDAIVPSNMKQLGYGKGVLTARIAVAFALGAQRAMEYGEDANVANRHLRIAKQAFLIAEEIAQRAKIMAAAQGRACPPPACRRRGTWNGGMMETPSDYKAGYEKARLVDKETADNYIAHTHIGDPVADAVVEELASLPQSQVHQFLRAGMDEDREGLRNAPRLLRDFFVDVPQPDPDWLDYDAFRPGVRAFQRNSVPVLSAFVTGVLIDGFSTLISKSFVQTGRIFDNGVWRLKQNNRHQMEVFWPGGLERHGDGWKLSVRIRFVHAQIRRLLGQTDEWEHDAWGVPVSAAHLGYAVACFAAHTVKHSEALGARYSPEERAGFHAVWRYAGYLMGIPEAILFTDESDALHIYRIGSLCEPPPTTEAIVMTNALINSAPLVAGIEDTEARKKLVKGSIYPVSRALIGNDLADQLKFPANRLPFALFWFRLDQRIQRLRARIQRENAKNFSTLLEASAYDDAGLSYRLPDHAHDERSGNW